MRSCSLRRLSLSIALLAACGIEEPSHDALPEFAESSDSIAGVDCEIGAPREVCSETDDVWSALYRVGRSSEALGDVAQTFTAPQGGFPERVVLKLRLLRPVTAGSPDLTVAIRPLVNGAISLDPDDDLARATAFITTFSRTLPREETFALQSTTPNAPVALTAGTPYALVLSMGATDAGQEAYVGVASNKTDLYPGGEAHVRGMRLAGATDKPFLAAEGGIDLAFALLVEDTTPDAFSFGALTNQPLATLVTSNAVTIAGLSRPVSVAVSNAELSIAGEAWATSGTIDNGQTLQLRLTTASTNAAETQATVNVGAAKVVWSVSTTPVDNATCLTIHNTNPNATSGVFSIDPDRTGPGAAFQVYCDMTPGNGGWTMLMGFKGDVRDMSYYDAPGTVGWIFAGGKGSFLGTNLNYASTYWSPAYGSVAGTKLRISTGVDRLTWTMPSANSLHHFVHGAGKTSYSAGDTTTGWAFDGALSSTQSPNNTNLAWRSGLPLKVRCQDGRDGTSTDHAVLGFRSNAYHNGYYCEGFGYPDLGNHEYRQNTRWYAETVGTNVGTTTDLWRSDSRYYNVWIR